MHEIVIVDDEHEIQEALRRELRVWSQENALEIRAFSTGDQALEYLRIHGDRVAILLTDNRMPGISGTELIRQVQQCGWSIVSLVLTGYTAKKDLQMSLKAGVFGFIVKPWERDELREELTQALQTAHLRHRNAEQERQLREELRMAQEFQQRYFEARIPVDTGSLVVDHVRTTPSGLGVGGDYLDFIQLPDDELLIIVGDVAGHGLRATFLAAILKSIIYPEFVARQGHQPISPADLLTWLNRRLLPMESALSHLFVALAVCRINVRSGQGVTACAGSPAPIIVRPDHVERVRNEALVLGVSLDACYSDTDINLCGGDSLFVFTDGLAPQGVNADDYVDEDLIEFVQTKGPVIDLGEGIAEICKLTGKPSFEDDVTLVRVRVGAPCEDS